MRDRATAGNFFLGTKKSAQLEFFNMIRIANKKEVPEERRK